jgi:hypothetical protein
LLSTARRVKRSLPPVRPSRSFQAGLEDELLTVARRLAVAPGARRSIVVDHWSPARPAPAASIAGVLLGLAGIAALLLLVLRQAGRARRR